jgi:hypothetical protein
VGLPTGRFRTVRRGAAGRDERRGSSPSGRYSAPAYDGNPDRSANSLIDFQWNAQYSGGTVANLKRLKELEAPKNRLNRFYNELALENYHPPRTRAPKTVAPSAKQQLVALLVDEFCLSQRRACQSVNAHQSMPDSGMPRSSTRAMLGGAGGHRICLAGLALLRTRQRPPAGVEEGLQRSGGEVLGNRWSPTAILHLLSVPGLGTCVSICDDRRPFKLPPSADLPRGNWETTEKGFTWTTTAGSRSRTAGRPRRS